MNVSQTHYNLGVEIDRVLESLGVAIEMGSMVVAGMSAATLQADITRGRAADTADTEAEKASDGAGRHLRTVMNALDQLCQSIRTNGKFRFQRSNPDLARAFHKVPARADSDVAVIGRAKELDAVWESVEDADTWEPVPGVKRADLRARIAEAEAAQVDAVTKETTASTADTNAQTITSELHANTVAYRTQGLSSYPRNSRERILFDGLPTTTERSASKSSGPIQVPA